TDYPAHLDELPFCDAREHVRRTRGKSRVTSLDGDAQHGLRSGRPHQQTSGRTERDFGLLLRRSERVVLLPFAPPRGLHVARDLRPELHVVGELGQGTALVACEM